VQNYFERNHVSIHKSDCLIFSAKMQDQWSWLDNRSIKNWC